MRVNCVAQQRRVSVLFSEPKIPHADRAKDRVPEIVFQCSSASRKFLNVPHSLAAITERCFSALQRAENSSIPHKRGVISFYKEFQCSSASRKFLNFALLGCEPDAPRFQCSSASRKFLIDAVQNEELEKAGFSALQRAENSSPAHSRATQR